MPSKISKKIDNSSLYVGFLHAPLTALGPGIRVGLWLSGCNRACLGCIAPELWDFPLSAIQSVMDVHDEIARLKDDSQATGLTISGGEPFMQADSLYALLIACHSLKFYDILIYSGFPISLLLKKYQWIPEYVTAIVDGAYETDNYSSDHWRGSNNQNLTIFSSLHENYYRKWQDEEKRKVQLIVTEPDTVRFLGIPQKGDYENLKEMIKIKLTD